MKLKNSGARLMKQGKENKTITKILRLTPSEWDKITTKMNDLGGITFSRYAINSMLSRPLTKTPITKELILELSRQGNNLNQIAYKLNKGESLDRVALPLINQSLERLNALYELLSDIQPQER